MNSVVKSAQSAISTPAASAQINPPRLRVPPRARFCEENTNSNTPTPTANIPSPSTACGGLTIFTSSP